MTFSTANNKATYTGNGVTVAFSFPYLFKDNDHLKVYVDGVITGSGFTITGSGNPSGGTVTFSIAPANGVSLVLLRQVPYVQETDIVDFDGNPAQVTEDQFDLCVMMASQLSEVGARAITVPVEITLSSSELSGTIDSTTRLMAISSSGPSTVALAEISTTLDTVITMPIAGDVLTYDGTNWVNEPSTIPDGSITTAKIGDDQVTAAKIADGAIDNAAKVSDFILGYYKMDIAAIASTANIISGTVAKLVPAASLEPYFATTIVRNSTAKSIASATFTALGFDTEDLDVKSWHDNVTNNSRITVDFTGVVSLSGHVTVTSSSNANLRLALYKNGVRISQNSSYTNTGLEVSVSHNQVVNCTSGDYFEFYAWHNNGSSLNTNEALTGACATRIR